VPINASIFDLLRVNSAPHLLELALCLTLALATAITLTKWRRSRWRLLSLLVPVAAVLLVSRLPQSGGIQKMNSQALVQLADWAETGTWGSSMFLFPDAGRELYPGTFRAASRRALWVDWSSGALVDSFDSVAGLWWERWEQTMEGGFSPERLQRLLSLPIDYYVLKRANRFEQVRPVFENREFIVYDAADLRRTSVPLRLARTQTDR